MASFKIGNLLFVTSHANHMADQLQHSNFLLATNFILFHGWSQKQISYNLQAGHKKNPFISRFVTNNKFPIIYWLVTKTNYLLSHDW